MAEPAVTAGPGDAAPTRVLGIGGTLRPGSTSERALRHALRLAEQMGAATEIITAQRLELSRCRPITASPAFTWPTTR